MISDEAYTKLWAMYLAAKEDNAKFAAAVGNLFDRWDLMPNDLLGAIEDSAPALPGAIETFRKAWLAATEHPGGRRPDQVW